MGIGPKFSKCSVSSFDQVSSLGTLVTNSRPDLLPQGNPNPKNFRIIRTHSMGVNCAVEVEYPDCTNYEGRKILVFRHVSSMAILALDSIDPHFCEDGHVSPFARFEPTEEGWATACQLSTDMR